MTFPDPRPWRNDELKEIADSMEDTDISMDVRRDRMAAAEHRTDNLFDAFYNEAGDSFSVYTNQQRTWFKITVQDEMAASVELDGDQMRRAMLIIEDALSRPDR